jgi:hypothetical protein
LIDSRYGFCRVTKVNTFTHTWPFLMKFHRHGNGETMDHSPKKAFWPWKQYGTAGKCFDSFGIVSAATVACKHAVHDAIIAIDYTNSLLGERAMPRKCFSHSNPQGHRMDQYNSVTHRINVGVAAM